MIKPITARTLCVLGAALCCLSCFSCGKKPAQSTTKATADTRDSAEVRTAETPDEIPEEEILYRIETWLGRGDEGKMTEMDSFATLAIESKKDLAPYRQYFEGLTDEDVDRILKDEGGKCILAEMIGPTENTLYGTSSITKHAGVINVMVSTDQETEDTIPLHTFFLLYFPSDIYQGESIQFIF